MLKNQENRKNCLNQENQKAKKWLSPKNRQKVKIYLNSTLKKLDQAF